MKDVYSIIQQLADQHLNELRPIDYILDYYTNPMKGYIDPSNKKELVIEWKDEDGRITEIQRYNTIINGYNAEVKNNKREFNKLLPLGDFSPSDLGYNKPLIYFGTIPFWAFNCISKFSRNITVDDKELYKLLYNELKDKNQFVQYLNKEIFNYIQSEIRKAKDLEAWDGDNMWYEPNKKFVEWFQIKNIDPNSKVLKKDETNDALWAIADDIRQRKEEGEFPTYMSAYRWAAKHMTQNGKRFEANSLQNEWHKAKAKGLVD